jgi:hypothetical protein
MSTRSFGVKAKHTLLGLLLVIFNRANQMGRIIGNVTLPVTTMCFDPSSNFLMLPIAAKVSRARHGQASKDLLAFFLFLCLPCLDRIWGALLRWGSRFRCNGRFSGSHTEESADFED